jgi:hypothetical protein
VFQAKELELLRLKKKQLGLQSDINRLKLTSEWQRFRSPENWLGEGWGLIKRHPVALAALAATSACWPLKSCGGRAGSSMESADLVDSHPWR